jgi:hypothetical protein
MPSGSAAETINIRASAGLIKITEKSYLKLSKYKAKRLTYPVITILPTHTSLPPNGMNKPVKNKRIRHIFTMPASPNLYILADQ